MNLIFIKFKTPSVFKKDGVLELAIAVLQRALEDPWQDKDYQENPEFVLPKKS